MRIPPWSFLVAAGVVLLLARVVMEITYVPPAGDSISIFGPGSLLRALSLVVGFLLAAAGAVVFLLGRRGPRSAGAP